MAKAGKEYQAKLGFILNAGWDSDGAPSSTRFCDALGIHPSKSFASLRNGIVRSCSWVSARDSGSSRVHSSLFRLQVTQAAGLQHLVSCFTLFLYCLCQTTFLRDKPYWKRYGTRRAIVMSGY